MNKNKPADPAPHKIIKIAGHKLEYRLIPGAEDAPTLIFLHEGLGSMALWRHFPDQVAAATGLPALIYSRAGYGGSDPGPLPRPLDYMEQEGITVLPALISALRLGTHILIGHSDGASIALVYAGSAKRHDLRGAALLAPHVFNEPLAIQSIADAKVAYETGGLRDKLKRWHGANVDTAFYGWNDAWLDPAFRDWSIAHYLPDISVPLLVIQGLDDEYGTRRQVDTIAAKAGRGAEIVLLENCAHTPQRDQEKHVYERLTNFIRDLL